MFENLDEATAQEVAPAPEEHGQVPSARIEPSGWLALELDHGTVEPARLSDAELIDAVTGFERLASWVSARQAVLLAEFARRRPEEDSFIAGREAPSPLSEFAADEIGLALRLSRTAAAGRLAVAQAVVADLPGTLAAWEAGVIDTPKVRAIADACAVLPRERCGLLEARVLGRAGHQTVAQLRAALSRAVMAVDPDGAQARHRQRRQDRRVVVSPEDDGMASLWALLSAPDAIAAHQRLGDLARDLGGQDPRGMDARRADLLVDLLTGRRCAAISCRCREAVPRTRAAGRGGAGRPGKPLVSVIVPITMMLGLDEQPGELVGYGPIPASVAREIAAEGTWRRLLTDPTSGTLLDHGRTTYTPPAGLADFVRARDVYCRQPGCRRRAASADLDHTVAWEDGGTTSERNLGARCRHDHRLKTFARGWTVKQHHDGRMAVTTPTGHTYVSHPYDYRLDPAPRPPPSDSPDLGPPPL